MHSINEIHLMNVKLDICASKQSDNGKIHGHAKIVGFSK